MHMQGHRFQNLDIIPYDPKIKRTIRQPRRQRDNSETKKHNRSKGKMAEARVENQPERKPMKSSFIPQNLNQPSFIAF
jgi:hypothetical protein